jgi:FkbM family methyltransferase
MVTSLLSDRGSKFTLRRAAATATDLACRTVGRRQVVRAARFVLWRARLDVPNDLRTNGESLLQRWVLDLSPPGQKIHIVDVGANVGRWSAAMLAAALRAGRLGDLDLSAFEPSAYTFDRLTVALNGQGVSLRRMAVSDRPGSSVLHVIAPGAGTNSLHARSDAAGGLTEEVTTITLDAYADQTGLEKIALVKIDTEGHDLAVLRGAQKLFAGHRIAVAQFEYNQRWIYARRYLRDAFDLLEPLGYRLGKLTPFGVEFYPGWESDLETFVEGNYVACSPPVAKHLPSIDWWKRGAPRRS